MCRSGVASDHGGKRVFVLRRNSFASFEILCIFLTLIAGMKGDLPHDNKENIGTSDVGGDSLKLASESAKTSQTGVSRTRTVSQEEQAPKEINQFPISNEAENPVMEGNDGNRRPRFLTQPQDQYVYKHFPASITCSAVGAKDVEVSCNDWTPSSNMVVKHRDDQSESSITLTVTVSRNDVESLFSKHKYWCQCEAKNSNGATKSRKAFVESAYLRKNFEQEPVGGEVVLGNEYKLHCRPPMGEPAPSVEWMKNDVVLDSSRDGNIFITQEGDLIIRTRSVDDSGNYSCVARNGASKRKSHPATLRVIVNGGWGEWRSWSGCGSKCGIGEERRLRTCTNPEPQNGGAPCPGKSTQTKPCTRLCPVDGGWTDWSKWSTCSPECVHRRRRTCSRPEPYNNGLPCPGSDIETKNCSGGLCAETRNLSVPADNQNLVLYSCLFVALALLLMIVIATMIVFRRKRGGNLFSRSSSSGFTSGRSSSAYPNSPANGHMRDDFCIIPTKPSSVMNGDPPYVFPPSYSALDQAYKICSYPGSQSGSDTSPAISANRYITQNEKAWLQSQPVCYHGNYPAPPVTCSRDDVTMPVRQFQGVMSSFASHAYHERSIPPPPVDKDGYGFAASGRSKDKETPKRVAFSDSNKMRLQQGYDSGFEGETNPNYAPKRVLRKTEPLKERDFEEEWTDSCNSSDAGYSGSDLVNPDTHHRLPSEGKPELRNFDGSHMQS